MITFLRQILNHKISSGNKERRRADRYARTVPVVFHAETGVIYRGKTENISLNAVYFVCNDRCSVRIRSKGRMIVDDQEHPMACTIARIDEQGRLALVIEGNESTLKQYIEPRKAASCCDCDSRDELLLCPMCRGTRTVCLRCLKRNESCMQCRIESLQHSDQSM